MLTAKVECMTRDTSGMDEDCNSHNCGECHLCYEQGNMGEQVEYLQMAIKALEEPQWILCSEELPEKNGVYLVCYEDVTVPLDWFNGKWFFYKSNPAVEETGTIIAWMQMPEPWKEGDVE